MSAAIAAIAGFALILHLPLNGGFRALIAVLWIAQSVREIQLWTLAAARVTRIQFNQMGDVWVIDRDGLVSSVELLGGSLVTRRLAWIRVRFADGHDYGELLRGNAVKDKQWHRFQLIWQQTRQIIGRAERS